MLIIENSNIKKIYEFFTVGLIIREEVNILVKIT